MSDAAPITPELLSLDQVAALLGVGPTLIKSMHADGRLGPQPVRLGRRRLWRRRELEAWIASGLPPRVKWAADRPVDRQADAKPRKTREKRAQAAVL